jgi:hypothetical protein
MLKTILPIVCLLVAGLAQAQKTEEPEFDKSEKLFYAELGGPGVLFSANFDSRFKKNTRLGMGFRLGLGFTVDETETMVTQPGGGYYYEYKTESVGTIPVGINYVFGKPKSSKTFEVGGGVTFLTKKLSILNYASSEEKAGNIVGHFEFMYRSVPLDGGFTWRIGFTPMIGTNGDIFPVGAVGLGYAFK